MSVDSCPPVSRNINSHKCTKNTDLKTPFTDCFYTSLSVCLCHNMLCRPQNLPSDLIVHAGSGENGQLNGRQRKTKSAWLMARMLLSRWRHYLLMTPWPCARAGDRSRGDHWSKRGRTICDDLPVAVPQSQTEAWCSAQAQTQPQKGSSIWTRYTQTLRREISAWGLWEIAIRASCFSLWVGWLACRNTVVLMWQ